MYTEKEKLNILNHLVGPIDEKTAQIMSERLECFLHPLVSVFIPATGQCPFALTPNHSHPGYSFIYYMQPVSDFYVEGKHSSYLLADGKCLSVMSPHIQHQEVQTDYFQSYIAIVVDCELFERTLSQYTNSISTWKGEAFLPSKELIGMLRIYMIESSEDSKCGLMDTMAEVITHMLVRSVVKSNRIWSTNQKSGNSEKTRNNEKTRVLYDRLEVDRAIAYMNSHMHEKVMLEKLAEQVNISQGQFSRVFKEVTGQSPIEFLNQMRLERARGMLLDGRKSITEIALECGFSTSAYFSACFQRRYEMSPSDYMKRIP